MSQKNITVLNDWLVIYELDVINYFGLKQTAFLFVSNIKNFCLKAVLHIIKMSNIVTISFAV